MKATKTFKMRGGRKVATLLAIASVVLACAAGTQTISSTGEFGESFIAGWETISYTGPTATYSGLFTANPGSQHGTTVEVSDPSATLTLANSAQSSGGLVKTGPGELAIKTGGITYAYSDVQGGYWSSYSHVRWTDGAADLRRAEWQCRECDEGFGHRPLRRIVAGAICNDEDHGRHRKFR